MIGWAAVAAVSWLAAAGDGRAARAFARDILETHERGAGAFAQALPPLEIQAERDGFRFVRDRGCEDPRDDAAFCAQAQPKAWTKEEIETVASQLAELRRLGAGPLMARARENGFGAFARESFVAHKSGKGSWERLFYPTSLHAGGLMVISDAQFKAGGDARRYVLHLLAHGADFRRGAGGRFEPSLSADPEFLRLSGFALGPDEAWRLRGMSQPDRAEFMSLFTWKNERALAAQGASPAEQRRIWDEIRERTGAFSFKHGAATFHALLNPHEAFAEWVVLCLLEPERARKADPALARWVTEKALR